MYAIDASYYTTWQVRQLRKHFYEFFVSLFDTFGWFTTCFSRRFIALSLLYPNKQRPNTEDPGAGKHPTPIDYSRASASDIMARVINSCVICDETETLLSTITLLLSVEIAQFKNWVVGNRQNFVTVSINIQILNSLSNGSFWPHQKTLFLGKWA
jgi:hypothetical protein